MTEEANTPNARMAELLEASATDWMREGQEFLWKDITFFEGFAQGHFLAANPEDKEVTLLRTWVSSGGDKAALSVDLNMDYSTFSGEIDEDRFPHAFDDGGELERVFREALSAEQAEMVWKYVSDSTHASFLARTWKAGREEHVVAGKVYSGENGGLVAEIEFRQPLASLCAAPSRGMSR